MFYIGARNIATLFEIIGWLVDIFSNTEPLENEMWSAILPEGWTSPYGET